MGNDPRIAEIDKLLKDGLAFREKIPQYGMDKGKAPLIEFNIWAADCAQFLMDNFDKTNIYASNFFEQVKRERNPNVVYPTAYHVGLGLKLLQSLKKYIISHPEYSKNKSVSAIEQIKTICDNFHLVVRQIRARRENRPTLDVNDEYDVQDLFRSLLWLFFNDIRPEEWTPSYAGSSSRIDFLLKNEKIAIEIKMTRTGRGNETNRIGEELLIDIDRYKEHPDCRTLICFVYDPDGRVSNPDGITADLVKKNTSSLKVDVFIRPTGR
jgi:hypothetical protein